MAEAWRLQLKSEPTKHAIILCVAQGTFETQMGRSWPGPDGLVGTEDDERNVGACTLRALSSAEYGAISAAMVSALNKAGFEPRGELVWLDIAHVGWQDADGDRTNLTTAELAVVMPWLPTVGKGHQDRAKNAEAAVLAAGLPLPSATKAGIFIPRSHVHCDSFPLKGGGNRPYHTWFAAFASLVDGCRYYLHLVAGPGKRARAVLENPNSTERDFAAALRAQSYYTGFFDNSTSEGWQKNVDNYSASLRRLTPAIAAVLDDWKPRDTEPAPAATPLPLNLHLPTDQWRALQFLGFVRPLAQVLTERRLTASVGFYQGAHFGDVEDELSVDGDCGPKTRAAMRRELRAIGIEVRDE